MLRFLFSFIALLAFLWSPLSVAKPKLTVYSYNSFVSEWGPGEQLKKGFEQQCDCEVNFVTADDGVTLLNRLRLEGRKTKADVVLGIDNNLLEAAKKVDIITPHNITKPDNLNTDWWDSDFMPYDYGYFAFIYNQNKIKTPPKSLHELVENKPNWKIIYQDPRSSTPGLGLLFWIKNVYGDDAKEAWKNIAKHTVTVTKGWSESYAMFLKGEADFVLSYTTSPVAHILYENNSTYVAALFSEGHYRQVEVAALIKYSQQQDLGRAFLTYLLSQNAQRELATKNIMYPIIKTDLPNAFAEIKPVTKALEFTSTQIADNQKIWIREWQNAVIQ